MTDVKRQYRDLMRQIVPSLEYMPQAVLDAQFATLQPLEVDEAGAVVDLSQTPDEIVGRIKKEIGQR